MIVIVDLDDTLICNDYNPRSSLEAYSSVSPGGFREDFIVRPYAKTFLRESKRLFSKVYLGSLSPRARVARVLSLVGIAKYFDDVFSREAFDPIYSGIGKVCPPEMGKDFIIVDDQEFGSPLLQRKLNFFVNVETENESEHIITVPAFTGDEDDKILLSVLEYIKSRSSCSPRST
jgi:hypothetical protein